MNVLKTIVYQTYVIFKKNLIIQTKSYKAWLGEFIMPLQVCLMIYLSNEIQNIILRQLLATLLPFYLGNLNSSLIRKFIVFFINEREQYFKQYQLVLGLNRFAYLIGNVLYMYVFTSLIISPVFLTLMYFNWNYSYIYYFAAFVISSSNLIACLSIFFKDAKVASQFVGMIFSLSVFGYFLVDLNKMNFYTYLLLCFPSNGFTISIMKDVLLPSSTLLLVGKIFLSIYAYKQLNINPLRHCKQCVHYLKKKSHLQEQQSEQLASNDLVIISNIKKKFNTQIALNDVSIFIKQGEILGLLGRNGAGKTTLIDIITQIQTQFEGKLQLKNEGSLGVCYQQQILYPDLTIEQLINFYIQLKYASYSQLDRVLKQVDLFHQKQKKVKDLSGGMKRRLSIAIAILGDPTLLIFDQPTSGLDPHSRRYVWDIFKKLKSRKKTILLTTHHLDQAEILSDRVYVIEKGMIIVTGSPNEIKKRYGSGYNLTIYGPRNKKQSQIIKSYINLQLIKDQDNHRKYTLRIKDQQHFEKIIEQLENIPELEISLQLNSLEQAFLSILKVNQLNGQQKNQSIRFELQRSPIGEKQQLKAMIFRNIYNIRATFFRSLLLYNLNILFLIIGIAISHVFQNIINAGQKVLETDQIQAELIAEQQYNSSLQMKKIMLLQGYYFSIGVYVTLIVYEKQKKIIDVMKVKGLKWWNYWISNFLVDYFIFVLNLYTIYFIIGDIVQFSALLYFGASLILFSYSCSYLFSTSKNATMYFPVINFLIGFMIPLVGYIKNQSIKNTIIFIFEYFYPFYAFQDSMAYGANIKTSNQYNVKFHYIQITIYSLLIILFESSIIKKLFANIQMHFIKQKIKLENVKKIYGKQQALKSLSLSVENKQILGLLGPNGAGKSTTFKILTNQIQQTSGTVYLQNKIHCPYVYNFQSSGVCYQQDNLWQNLNSSEILTIFGLLTGVSDIKKQCMWLYDNIQMEHPDKKFEFLSGGNRRKLCFAVCLIGKPSSKFLDQCSTGLDPMSRRSMTSILQKQQTSVVFTTHSMNEAQAVCSKIAILIKGELVQHKTIKELKDKYYRSYFSEIQLLEQQQKDIDKLLREVKKYRIIQEQEAQNKIKIQINKQDMKLSQLLKIMYSLKNQRRIKDFSVFEPNLQDIYLEVTKDK